MKSYQSDYEDVAACLISSTSSGGLTPKIKKKVQKGQSVPTKKTKKKVMPEGPRLS
jgi:hypothetical protein